MIKTESVTVIDPLTKTQPSTTPNPFPDLELLDTPTVPTFTELLAEYNASISQPKEAKNRLTSDEAPDPFAIYQSGGLTNVRPQPVQWLWQNRLPLAGITLLDGDHGCGKSLLALQIAAHVSSGMPMLDDTPTIPGGVIVITPHINAATTQLQLLTALGADLSRVEVLSYVPEPNDDDSTSRYRPFSLPEDMDHLLEAIKRLDARLIVLDPLMSLLSHHNRWTDQRLAHLLSTLNQRLIERNVACLITRNCHGKGGYARPSILERSERFSTIAVSRLLLAPDPMYPDRPLLSHVLSRHNIALTPTCSLQIQPLPGHPDLPYITFHGYHNLLARDFIDYRSDTLHRRLLSDHLLAVITKATDPIHVSTLYTLFPHCSAFQIQRSLSDLLRTDQIQVG
jgi:AAA domain